MWTSGSILLGYLLDIIWAPISALFQCDFLSKILLSNETFFKSILLANDSRENEFMEKNKSIEYEKRERLWEKTAYVSANGLNYIKLYRKTYDQYLKKQYS